MHAGNATQYAPVQQDQAHIDSGWPLPERTAPSLSLLRALLGSTDLECGRVSLRVSWLSDSIAPFEDRECNNRANHAYDYQRCQVCKPDVAALECALRIVCCEDREVL